MGFVFFDTETSGLKYGFDQILHFAAIRTDADLNEIDRIEARSRLLPHVTPHPKALLTNGLSIDRLIDPELQSHYEMVCAIRQKLLKWSPAIFIGYNSIRFDEEMLRHALFQTLHPAYLTSFHGNCRADALSVVMAAATASPATLSVGRGTDGQATFKLGAMALANGVPHTQAHDAMGDVLATIGLCRLVHERAPDLWQRVARFSKKATVADFVEAEDGFVLTEFFGGKAYHTPVGSLGDDPNSANGRLCLDLRQLEALAALDDQSLLNAFAAKPSPIRRFRTNAAPAIVELWDAPDSMLVGITLEDAEAAARRLKDEPDLRDRLLTAYLAGVEPWPISAHIEERLHGDRLSYDDEQRCFEFHDATWAGRAKIVERFEDERLKVFGRRLIYSERRSALSPAVRDELDQGLRERLLIDNGGALTLERALEEAALLMTDGDPNGWLAAYYTHLTNRLDRARAHPIGD